MHHLDIFFFLSVAVGYVTFGLAIYAVAGWIALMWVRKNTGTPWRVLRELYLAYASIIGLIFLDAFRQLWDSLHMEQFPAAITRVLLPALYLLMGNTLVKFANLTYPAVSLSEEQHAAEQQTRVGV